jgi:hypothetical protein
MLDSLVEVDKPKACNISTLRETIHLISCFVPKVRTKPDVSHQLVNLMR